MAPMMEGKALPVAIEVSIFLQIRSLRFVLVLFCSFFYLSLRSSQIFNSMILYFIMMTYDVYRAKSKNWHEVCPL